MRLLQGLVGKSLGEDEVTLQRLTIYWNAGEMPVRWSEYVNYKLPGGKRLIGLSLSPAPTGMELVLAPMNNQYLVDLKLVGGLVPGAYRSSDVPRIARTSPMRSRRCVWVRPLKRLSRARIPPTRAGTVERMNVTAMIAPFGFILAS